MGGISHDCTASLLCSTFGVVWTAVLILIGCSLKSCAEDKVQEQKDIRAGGGDATCTLQATPGTLVTQKRLATVSEYKRSPTPAPSCDYFDVSCTVTVSIEGKSGKSSRQASVQAGKVHKSDGARLTQAFCDGILSGAWPNLDLGAAEASKGNPNQDMSDFACGEESQWFTCKKQNSDSQCSKEPCAVEVTGPTTRAMYGEVEACTFQPRAGAQFDCLLTGSGQLQIGSVASQLDDKASEETTARAFAGIFIGFGILLGLSFVYWWLKYGVCRFWLHKTCCPGVWKEPESIEKTSPQELDDATNEASSASVQKTATHEPGDTTDQPGTA